MMIFRHVFLLSSTVLLVTAGAGEDERDTILKDVFINSLKVPVRTAHFIPLLLESKNHLMRKNM